MPSVTGCSSAGCFDCCKKIGRPCQAHAKQLERKRVEEELLSGGVIHGRRGEDQRLPKGVFKEEAIHAIGDTATVWCFEDFVRSKSNQATFKTLSRAQRASKGRYRPRPSRDETEGDSEARGGDKPTKLAQRERQDSMIPDGQRCARRPSRAIARWRQKHMELLAATVAATA